MGGIHSKRVFASIEKRDGFPDGLAVDADGHVWSAHWDEDTKNLYKRKANVAEGILRVLDIDVNKHKYII